MDGHFYRGHFSPVPMATADRHPDRHQETCGDRPGVGPGDGSDGFKDRWN